MAGGIDFQQYSTLWVYPVAEVDRMAGSVEQIKNIESD